MAKKRKSDTGLDEVDRSMYTSFCSAANSLSQLYTQSMNQQKLSFHAGERHSLEKLYDWILRRQEDGSRVNTIDIVTYLQNELEYGLEETTPTPNTGLPGHSDHQPKNSVFSNALSSPVRRSLLQYHLSQGGLSSSNVVPSGNGGARNTETTYPHHQIGNDSLMDMHADSPGREPPY